MNDGYYLKCTCLHCGGHIEFPATGEGDTVNCPHCGQLIKLSLDEPDTEEPSRRGLTLGLIAVIVCLLLAGGAGAFFFLHKKKTAAPAPPVNVAVASTNVPPPEITNAEPAVHIKAKKSPTDLKVGDIQLEKTKGSSLVYAVGTVKNDSDYQRFGVKIELDLFNQKGTKIGTAQDYIAILEPRREWQFRALLPDPRAVSAKVATLKEEE